MTFEEFLTHLAKHKNKFRFDKKGRLRIPDSGHLIPGSDVEARVTCSCPGLIGLAEAYPKAHFSSGHLDFGAPSDEPWRFEVLRASDNHYDHDPIVRAKLLETLGLTES